MRLIRSKNIGPSTFFKLINKFGSPKKALNHIPKENVYSDKEAIKELKDLKKFGAEFITYKSPIYPKLLREIYDPPPFLSYLGNIDLINKDICAIVGSRNASFHGEQFTCNISKELSNNGITIASGLANGIDSKAHISSLPNTVAVIAGGIDNIYPAHNHRLYKDISEKGLIIAESKIGTSPTPHSFPRRNRIIAGISKVTLVIEAGLKSGSLITAKLSLEMGREVGAVPGYPMDPRSKGTNKLIRDGALMVESAEDILDLFGKEISSSEEKETISNVTKESSETGNKEKILSIISSNPISINDICAKTNLDIPSVCEVLIPEEIEGNIVRIDGNKFAKA